MTLEEAIRVIADDFARGSGCDASEVCAGLLTLEGASEWIADEREDDEFEEHSTEWKEAAAVVESAHRSLSYRERREI
jgi:hypothetical protein